MPEIPDSGKIDMEVNLDVYQDVPMGRFVNLAKDLPATLVVLQWAKKMLALPIGARINRAISFDQLQEFISEWEDEPL